MPWRRDRLSIRVFLGFCGGSAGKESACNVGDLHSIPGLGRSPGGGHGNPPNILAWKNSHGQKSLAAYSPWVAKSQTQLNNLRENLSVMNTGSHVMLWEISSLSPSLFFFLYIIYLTSYPFLLFFLALLSSFWLYSQTSLIISSGEKYDLQCF